ncbi:MAG TPA: polyprenyl synthetase family protein, partial [Anaerolineales bacterium]|nr:polyprenyl synthetase family protein [Anaerolineales bacterium]
DLGVALNAAVGMFFGAMRLLNSQAAPLAAAQAIRAVFTQTYLVMSAGQQRDLAGERLDLAAFWEVAQAKSGAFFGLACWSGARLATDDPERLAALHEFGEILGVLIQIGDEQADVLALNNGALIEPRTRRILPVVYAVEVASPDRQVQIEDLLAAGAGRTDAAQTLYRIVEQEGAGLYMAVERERRRTAALAALNRSRPDPPAAQQLAEFVQRLVD